MGKDSNIEWTTHTHNPWRGCTKVSAGCDNCYAESMSRRNPKVLGVWGDGGTRVVASEATLRAPFRWNREAGASGERHRVFCASLADVFEDRPELVAPRARLWQTILATPNLDWLLLTKRPGNVVPALKAVWDFQKAGLLNDGCLSAWIDGSHPPDNVWLGVSVEDQATADERIPLLIGVPANVRFLSAEPLLGPLDLVGDVAGDRERLGPIWVETPYRTETDYGAEYDVDVQPGIDWVIVGGESGPRARPLNLLWARSLCDQCDEAGVAYFFKQWGEWLPDGQGMPYLSDLIGGRGAHETRVIDPDGRDVTDEPGATTFARPGCVVRRVGKKAAGRVLDGRTWDEFPAAAAAVPRV